MFGLCLVHPLLPISLDCPILIASSVFFNVYFHVKKQNIIILKHTYTKSSLNWLGGYCLTPNEQWLNNNMAELHSMKMMMMLVVYGDSWSRICGGSRGSDHCACLTGSDRKWRDRKWRDRKWLEVMSVTWPEVTSPEVTWLFPVLFPVFCPVLFPRILFPYFFSVLFSRSYLPYFFSRIFSPVLFPVIVSRNFCFRICFPYLFSSTPPPPVFVSPYFSFPVLFSRTYSNVATF